MKIANLQEQIKNLSWSRIDGALLDKCAVLMLPNQQKLHIKHHMDNCLDKPYYAIHYQDQTTGQSCLNVTFLDTPEELITTITEFIEPLT